MENHTVYQLRLEYLHGKEREVALELFRRGDLAIMAQFCCLLAFSGNDDGNEILKRFVNQYSGGIW